MRPSIEYVVQVVWPKHSEYSYKEAFQTILVNSFVKCLPYTSDVLQVRALAIPAEGIKTRDTPQLTIASALYSAQKKYHMELVRNETTPTLPTVYIVTNDSETLSYKLFQLLSSEPPQPVPVRPTPGLKAYRRRRVIEQVEKRAQLWNPEILAGKQKKDPSLKKVAEWLTSGNRPDWNEVRGSSPPKKAYWNQYENLSLVSGVIYRTILPETDAEEEFKQLLLPCGLKTKFFDAVHQDIAGHLGNTKKATHVVRRAYWFNWRRDVLMYIKRCKMCNSYHRSHTQLKQGPLMPLLTGSPVERWACDLAGPFPKSTKGHVYILTAICTLTKFIILVPLKNKTAISVATAIFEKVVLKFRAGKILTDNGGEFRCGLLDELCRLMGVARSYTK